MEVISSSPGKVLLIGSYSVLERPSVALVLGISARARVKIEENKENFIFSPQLDLEGYEEELKENKKAKFITTALECVRRYIKLKNLKEKKFKIESYTDEEFKIGKEKSGLGSSASITTATIAGLLAFYGIKDKETIHKLSQYAHNLAQKNVGSGVDVAAATFGTVKYVRFSPLYIKKGIRGIDEKWDYEIKRISYPKELRNIFFKVTKKSTSTTEAIKKIIKYKESNFDEYKNLINEIDKVNRNCIAALEKKDWEMFKIYFEKGRELTNELGKKSAIEIEPPEVRDIIEKIKIVNNVLGVKATGAGGYDNIMVICKNSFAENEVKKIIQREGCEILNFKVMNRGVKVEIRRN